LRCVALALILLVGCSLRDPPARSGAHPLPADPPLQLETDEIECGALLAALERYQTCVHHTERDVQAIDGWLESARRSFAAARKTEPEPNARQAMAGACRRATLSVNAAHERCLAGPRPKEEF
jgi:hypothetical protein